MTERAHSEPRTARAIFEEYLERKRGAFQEWEALTLQGWPDYSVAIRNRYALQVRYVDGEAYRAARVWEREGAHLEALKSLGAIETAINASWSDVDEVYSVQNDSAYATIMADIGRLQRLTAIEDVDPPFEEMRKRPEAPALRAALSRRMGELDVELGKKGGQAVVKINPGASGSEDQDAAALPPVTPRYEVRIADNYHDMDSSEDVRHGYFESYEEAVAACKRIVDGSLRHLWEPAMEGKALYDKYRSFGDDPFVVCAAADVTRFSAWEYALERCEAICTEQRTGQ